MDIQEELLYEHSKTQRDKILRYIAADKEKFAKLMNLFFGKDRIISQRAAWVMSYCAEEHPELIKPYLSKLVNNLSNEGLHDAIKRNTLRVLQNIDAPEKVQGKLIAICYTYILSKDEPAAVKAFALSVVYRICIQQPDLLNELKVIVDDLLQHSGSPAILARCKHIKRDFTKRVINFKK